MRLLLFVLLAVTLVGSASAIDLTTKANSPEYQVTSRVGLYCSGVNFDSAFYQSGDAVYGNTFDVGVGGPLSYLDFIHYGYGFAGPYDFNLFVYDPATCTELAMIPGLVASDAGSAPVEDILDVCEYNVAVTGIVLVGVQGLDCYAPGDCYPDLAFDWNGDGETPGTIDGCGSVVDLTEVPPGCYQITATDGAGVAQVVDFLFGIWVDECPPPVATEETTWGAMKALYR